MADATCPYRRHWQVRKGIMPHQKSCIRQLRLPHPVTVALPVGSGLGMDLCRQFTTEFLCLGDLLVS